MPRTDHLINLRGKRFGRLTVLWRSVDDPRKAGTPPTWFVQCDCGRKKVVAGANLRRGCTQSCGACLKHGWFGKPEYSAWVSMIQRCYNHKTRSYPHYGGRGITVCQEWRASFKAFLNDLGPRPKDKTSLDRIDSQGNYGPGNVRWANWTEQARNKRTSRVLVVRGESALLVDWAQRVGLGRSTVRQRLKRGWTPERAVETPAG